MKKVLALVLVAVMALSLTSGAMAAEGKGYKVALVNYSVGNSYRTQMVAEFEEAAKAMQAEGIISEYFITNSNNDVAKQISDVQDMITKGVDAIVITAASPTALAPAVEEAVEEGIVVVSFDNLVDSDLQTATVGIDEKGFGRIGAEFIVEALGGEGKVIALNGIAGTATDADRWEGAEEVFKKHPGIEILGSANADWDYAKGKAAVESMLSAYPEIDAVWSQGGAMTQGAIDAFVAAGRPLVPMSGEGNNGFLRVWLENKDNGFICAAPSNPTHNSAEALRIAIKALNGEEVSDVVMETLIINESNIDAYYNPDLPDSYWVYTELSPETLATLYAGE